MWLPGGGNATSVPAPPIPTKWDSTRVVLCAHHMWFMTQTLQWIYPQSTEKLTSETLLALYSNTPQSFSVLSSFSTLSPTLVSFGCWLPVFSTNYWQTNLPLFIDVRVIDLCFKCNLRRFEWIFCWEVDFDSEGSFIIWRIVLQEEGRMSRMWHMLMDTSEKQHGTALGFFDLLNDLFERHFLPTLLPGLCVRKHQNLCERQYNLHICIRPGKSRLPLSYSWLTFLWVRENPAPFTSNSRPSLVSSFIPSFVSKNIVNPFQGTNSKPDKGNGFLNS